MPIRIGIAITADQIDAVQRLRHRVFIEQEAKFAPRPDGRVTDGYDTLPATVNFIAGDGGAVVGGLRLTRPSDAGLPTDHWGDFSAALPPGCTSLAAGSLLCVDRSHREDARVFVGLVGMAQVWMLTHGITHVVGLFNPAVEPIFVGTGGHRAGEPFWHEDLGVPAVPIVIDLGTVIPRVQEFVARQRVDHFLQSFDREFAGAGEILVRKGDTTDTAYVVIDGRVAVSAGEDEAPLAELGPGQIFGELASLTAQPRTANVTALTDVDLMVVEREALLGALGDPANARRLLQIVAERLASTSASMLPAVLDHGLAPAASF